jgi:outer membrane protein assembly factor BamB
MGKVKVHESVCFAIVREGSEWFVGKFDTTLALLARSRVSVLPETDLAVQGGKLYVQTSDGKVAVLNLDLSSP